MPNISQIVNDADYLLNIQKGRLLRDLAKEGFKEEEDLEHKILDFIECVIGIPRSDLMADDMNKIDAWLEHQGE